MPHQEPKPKRPAAKRRRRSPTRPNVYVTIIGAPTAAPSEAVEPVPAATEEESGFEAPLVSPEWLERRSKRLDSFEQELRKRALDLDVREAELEEREARFEADVFLREDALELRERAVAEQENRLGSRETDLSSYVARVQGGFLRADAG
jgi:hypothetical protein